MRDKVTCNSEKKDSLLKMQFSPDPNKQAHEVKFSRKLKVYSYPHLIFNNNDVEEHPHQKIQN